MNIHDLTSDQRASALVVAAAKALHDTLPITITENLVSGDRIEVGEDGDHSWWTMIAGNNEPLCTSEMYDGPDHHLVALRQADHFAARMAFHTPVIDLTAAKSSET